MISYQPRILYDPEHPKTSPWTLAIWYPSVDDEAYLTFDEACHAGVQYCEEFNVDLSTLMIAMLSVEYLTPHF